MSKTQLNYAIFLSASTAIAAQMSGIGWAFALLKPLTTILIILVVTVHSQAKSSIKNVVITALIACLVGDIFLLKDSQFAYGLSSFLVAHLLFTFVFYSLSKDRMRYAPLLALTLFAAAFYHLLLSKLGSLWIPVAVYQLCICVMCWQAINLYLGRRDHIGWRLCIASILFVFSDSIIAVNKFLAPFELSGLVVLSSYWLSIALIANVFASDTFSVEPN